MRGGVLLIVIALLIGYLAVTGKYKCFSIFFTCVSSGPDGCGCGSPVNVATAADTTGVTSIPAIDSLPPIEAI